MTGSPPAATSKKRVPQKRSNVMRNRATASTGSAVIIRKLVTSAIQLNSGTRIMRMPGARMLMIVVMKLTPPMIDATPRICSPNPQKSMFMPGEYCVDDRFA